MLLPIQGRQPSIARLCRDLNLPEEAYERSRARLTEPPSLEGLSSPRALELLAETRACTWFRHPLDSL
eukprot:8871475-Lingulodinium_polyedra.AAC.1